METEIQANQGPVVNGGDDETHTNTDHTKAMNGKLDPTEKVGKEEEEETNVVDGELIHVAEKSREFLEAQEKARELEIELEKISLLLKESESQNAMLKEEVLVTKEKLGESGTRYEELELNHKKLQEQIAGAEGRYGSQCAAMEELEAKVKIQETELSKFSGEKQEAEAALSDLTKNAAEMKELCNELEAKLKNSDENFSRTDFLLSQALENKVELEQKLETIEQLHRESQHATIAAEDAKTQLREFEARFITAQESNVELQQQLNVTNLENSEFSAKISELNATLEKHSVKVSELEEQLKTSLKSAVEKEKESSERLTMAAEEKKKLEDAYTNSTVRLAESDNLLDILRNELKDTQQKQESIENDLKAAVMKESEDTQRIGDLEQQLNSVSGEKEASIQHLASHMNTVAELTQKHATASEALTLAESRISETEMKLEEAMQKLAQKDLEAVDLAEKLRSLQDLVKIHEEQVCETSALAEGQKVELERTIANWRDQERIIEELKIRSHKLEEEIKGLLVENSELSQKVSDLETKSSTVIAGKNEEVEGLKKVINNMAEELSSAQEENKKLQETHQHTETELVGRIAHLEEQLKEHKSSKDALESQIDILTADISKKSELQNLVKELEEQLANIKAQVKEEDQLEVKSRDIGSTVSAVTNPKSNKEAAASSGQPVSSDSQSTAPLKTMKHIVGVALVSVITGVVLGKRY